MSDFLKKFLLEDPRRFNPSGRYVALAAFGKHPGWDDHVEDLGLETESLNFAKLVLYVNGIGGQIDSGAWEKLEPAQQLPGFNHLFVWQRSGQLLIGRMWSSSDGKGRKRYPMVVCFHFMGVPLGWALKQALPVLADLEKGCLNTNSAADVRSLLARKRAALQDPVQAADGKAEYAPLSPDALHRILSPAGTNQQEGFARVLYQMHGQLGAFAPGVFSLKTSPGSVHVQQIRVPRATANAEESLLFWSRFFLTSVDSSVPLLLTLPLESDWLDVTAGEPESHEFFCLRATPKAVPLVSEVPYKLEEDFRSKATAFLRDFQQGQTARPDFTSAPASVSVGSPPAPSKGGWLKWLGVGVVLLLAGGAAVVLLPKLTGTGQPSVNSPATIAKVQATNTSPLATAPANSSNSKIPATQVDSGADAAALAEEKKKADAIAAAARLKNEIEAAAKEKERQLAEAAAKEKERLKAEAEAREKARQLAEAAALEKQKQLAEAAAREKQAAEAAKAELEKQAALAQQNQEQTKPVVETAALKIPSTDQAPTQVSPPTPTIGSVTTKPTAPAVASTGGSSEMTNSVGMVLVLLPSGLWVGKYEVTQAEYIQVMKSNPSNPKWLNDRQPVQQVTWNDAVEFTRKLTELEHDHLPTGKVYSLPTEQQWKEFSAGQTFEELPNATAIRKEPALVGQSGPANKLGLYDVLGNLWEWCLDDQPGDQKLLKGGAFNSNNYDRALRPDAKSLSCGFRCVLASGEAH